MCSIPSNAQKQQLPLPLRLSISASKLPSKLDYKKSQQCEEKMQGPKQLRTTKRPQQLKDERDSHQCRLSDQNVQTVQFRTTGSTVDCVTGEEQN